MRGVIGVVLAGLGAFLILVAILLPTWVTSEVVKFPLNEYETATLEASNASYFSTSSFSEKTGVTLEATYTIKGDPSKGSSSTAVWNEFDYVYDLTNHFALPSATRTFAFDRRTAQLVSCCGASVDGDKSVRQTGVAGDVFPIGTQKQTYQVFDTTLKRPVPFTYSGTATVDGIQTYEFVENVAPVQFATLPVPGSFIGSSAALVSAPEFDQLHLIYYVDPETGALLDVNEHQTLTLRNPATGTQALVLLDADLIATPASVQQIVGLDNSGRSELDLLQTILPLVLGLVGGVALLAGIYLSGGDALLAGIFLGRKARDERDKLASAAPETAEAPETARVAAEPGLGHQPAELAGVVPAEFAGTQELAEMPEGESPDGTRL